MLNTEAEFVQVHVAAGVIIRGSEVLLSKRLQRAHQGGLWEFPGGKVEPGESVALALARELQEELGLVVTKAEPMMKVDHNYGDKHVLLDVWIVRDFEGEAVGREGQSIKWCALDIMPELDFPDANTAIVTEILRRSHAGVL